VGKAQKRYQTDSGSVTVFDKITNYLNQKYQVRYNEIALEFEIRTENEDWEELNINSLFIELIQSGINITLNKLEILLKSHLIDKYNPIYNYFKNLPKMER
jgi:hypothetical protein